MALDLYMLGLIVKDMAKSLEFYRRLGLEIPDGSENKTHVEIKMGNGLTFFLDSRPARWDPEFVIVTDSGRAEESAGYHAVLEFYLQTQTAVEAMHAELTGLGYQSQRVPYATTFGMCFAMIKDPDGNTILLSGDLGK
jgi:catechol 2,3-dioxygenase-like lactoylglutathione lyase family enzyme